ncbi:MAG: bifunctional diguanylate cyclase/phosphodiesterase [Halomonadaceae bacterium]|nr:MAG: bifunctional diguanylate cyclase/phosphodiesterase [Halomonadaceae bacterium]
MNPERDRRLRPMKVEAVTMDEGQLQADARHSTEWLKSVFRCCIEGILSVDRKGKVLAANPAAASLLGYTEAELLGRDLDQLLGSNSPTSLFSQLSEMRGNKPLEISAPHRYGDNLALRLRLTTVESAPVHCFLLMMVDVSNETSFRQQLTYQSKHDPLTGMMNRTTLEGVLRRVLQRLQASPARSRYWLAWLDLSGFKAVNESFGHHGGDLLLKRVATLMQSLKGDKGIIGRVGGNEFAWIIQAVSEHDALARVTKMCERIRAFQLPWGNHSLRVGVTASLVPIKAEDSIVNVFLEANAYCDEAKRQGRNRIVVGSDDKGRLRGQLTVSSLATQIPAALENDQFALYLMGIFSTEGQLCGAEVLIRYPEGKQLIMPTEIILAAETHGLMAALDEWVVKTTLFRLQSVTRWPADFYIAINLSTITLSQPDFLDRIKVILNNSNVDPKRLVFEVTETATLVDPDNIFHALQKIRGLGCRVALDDFGQGTSSLTMMEKITADFLKIDGHFVYDARHNLLHQQMVEAVAKLSKTLGLKTVAEHVRSIEDASLLAGLGVDAVQGFAFQKPMEWSAFFQSAIYGNSLD